MKHEYLFTYGTLQPGCSRFHAIEELVASTESAEVEGYSLALYILKAEDKIFYVNDYPFVVSDSDSTVKGTLIAFDEDVFPYVLKMLDAIERGYKRRVVEAKTENDSKACYMYINPPTSGLVKVSENWQNLKIFH